MKVVFQSHIRYTCANQYFQPCSARPKRARTADLSRRSLFSKSFRRFEENASSVLRFLRRSISRHSCRYEPTLSIFPQLLLTFSVCDEIASSFRVDVFVPQSPLARIPEALYLHRLNQ